MIREIAGRHNQSVRLARKLQQKKHRRDRGLLVCEGLDLLEAAVEGGAHIVEVLVREDLVHALPDPVLRAAEDSRADSGGADVGVCSRETLEYASGLGGGADVISVFRQPLRSLADIPLGEGTAFFLDGVGDPGNVGTITRTSYAFGLTGVICGPGTADPFSPKAMRAGMGSQFMLPVVADVAVSDINARIAGAVEKAGAVIRVLVADAHQGEDVALVRKDPGAVIVLGSEREGASVGWHGARRVTVPQSRGESLNVAMAATVIAYAWSRQDGQGGVGN